MTGRKLSGSVFPVAKTGLHRGGPAYAEIFGYETVFPVTEAGLRRGGICVSILPSLDFLAEVFVEQGHQGTGSLASWRVGVQLAKVPPR